MTDPYRSSPLPCPLCKTSLREFGRRLVCDECNGMLLEVDDFFESIGTQEKIELVDHGATTLACPRCTSLMHGAQMRVGKLYFDHVLGRCEEDGLWLPAAAMEDVFTQVGRAGHRGATQRSAGGVSTYAPLYSPPKKPRPTPAPTSAYKDRLLPCPVCKSEIAIVLDRWPCASCGGTFVENDALVAMVTAMTGAPWQLPAAAGDEGARPCPICSVAMRTEPLEDVVASPGSAGARSIAKRCEEMIDRCAEHGIWFDPAELGEALRHAGEGEPRGLGGWLKRLF